MELLTQLLQALWAQDFETLANPSMIGMLYFVLFVILFLENGLLPAAFLPGDSLLVLVGVLIAKGAMGYPQTILLLTVAASLGCWVSYIQGRWLGNTRTVQNWLSHLPAHYHQRAHHLFHKHGLFIKRRYKVWLAYWSNCLNFLFYIMYIISQIWITSKFVKILLKTFV